MSRLQELIAELCPDGVEYKALGEVFEKRNGYTPSKNNSSYWEGGTIPWFRMEDIRANGTVLNDAIQHVTDAALKKGGAFPANSIIVATSATIGAHALITCDFLCNQRFTCLTLREAFADCFDLAFLNHYFVVLDEYCLANVNQGSFASVKMGAFDRFRIPVPPIEVQREVVCVLDEYAAAHDELVKQLEEEIHLREQQLSIARNELLTFSERERVRWMALGEVCRVGRGTYITGKEVVPGDIPVILGGMEPAYYHNVSNHEGEAIVVSRSGVNAGYASFWNEPIFVSDGFVVDSPAKDVSLRYVFEVMKSRQQEMIGMNRGSGVPHITGKMLSSLRIPLPTIDAQDKLVDTLGNLSKRFDDFCAVLDFEKDFRDAEQAIVRNQLLSFPEKVA